MVFSHLVGAEQIDGVTAVVVRMIGGDFIASLHITQRVGSPQIKSLQLVAETDVDTGGITILDDEILKIVLRLLEHSSLLIGGVALVVHLIAVHVEQLVELLVVPLHVGGEMLDEVILQSCNEMERALETGVGHVLTAEGGGMLQ